MMDRGGQAYLRAASLGVSHLDTFLEGWYRGFEARGLSCVRLPSLPMRRLLALAACKSGLHRGRSSPRTRVFVPMHWASDVSLFPAGYLFRMVPWIFDCWPGSFDRWALLLRRLKVDRAFASSQAAVHELSARLPDVRIDWIPEAVDPLEIQRGPPLKERSIDVLELGRRSEEFHAGAVRGLKPHGFLHVFNAQSGDLLFAGKGELSRALASSRISVCFPKSVTHPRLAGHVETATYRYFEAFAAGCLPVGHCPAELRDLWGFNPVVEVAPRDSASALPDIIRSISSFQELVDRNHARFLEVGCWSHRAASMIALDRSA